MSEANVSDIIDKVRVDARARLLDLLDEVTGKKVLVLDSAITGPLDLIVNPSDLKDHGVEHFFKLSDQPVDTQCQQMIFVVRSARVELVDWIATQIHEDERQGKDIVYVVMFIPRKTDQCVERLGRANVRANVRIKEYGLHYFPMDRDVVSMEMPGIFRDYHVNGDPSGLFYAAKALMYLESKFGVIPLVHNIGGAAKTVMDIMIRLRREDGSDVVKDAHQPTRELTQPGVPPVAPHAAKVEAGGDSKVSQFSEIIMLDRRVDLFSVLCSQFTYQALVDMVFGVNNNAVDVSSTDFAKEGQKLVRLSPEDPFFQEIRDLHIDELGPFLSEKATQVQQIYAEKDNINKKHSKEMAEYIKKFTSARAEHELLQTHINLAHHLKSLIQTDVYRSDLKVEDEITAGNSGNSLDTVEDAIDDQRPIHEVLRLLCLYSLANNGIKQKQLDIIKRNLIQAYGYEHLLTLSSLERVGLLRYQQGRSEWPKIKRQFDLFVEGAPNDVSYAYSGYAPLSVRLVEKTTTPPRGWLSCRESLDLLYGPTQCFKQNAVVEARDQSQPSVVLVCFLGGVTYGEIAALRRLSEKEKGHRKFLIVTTELINTKKLFDYMKCEQVVSPALIERKQASRPQEQKKGGTFGGFFGR